MTNNELLEAILNRLDLIYTSHLFFFGCIVAIAVVYVFYRVLSDFF